MSREEFNKQVELYISYLENSKSTSEEGSVEFNISKNQLNALELVKYALVYNPSIVYKLGSPEKEKIHSLEYKPKSYCSKYLNDSQKDAVIKALNMNDILVVQGPPGTGKTTVIAEMIRQLKRKNPKARFLITSASHLAVDNVLESLSENGSNISMVRIRSKEKRKTIQQFEIESYLNDYYSNFKGSEELKNALKEHYEKDAASELKELTKNFDLVAITLNAIIGTRFDISKPFDYVIIDEVAKSTLPEVCSCLIYAKKAIFIGDNKQLTPIVRSDSDIEDEETKYLGDNSYIEYLFTHIDPSSKAFLNKQFRMSNNIGSFVSDEFYQNPKLLNGADKPNDDGLNYVDYKDEYLVSTCDQSNEIEGDIIEKLLALLPEGKEIAIISPYKEQIRYLKYRFKGLDYLNIGTIDSFQGQGMDIVLCSIARNDGSNYFISNPNRINVAISRAKEQFWLIGKKDYLSKIQIYRHYYHYSKNNKMLVNAYLYENEEIIKK